MSKFNVSTNHPIIPNAQEYMYETKYLSINSTDINTNKYPNISNFEIELPQDYCNVQSFCVSSWTFPTNINTYSKYFRNTTMTFQINQPYRPTFTYVPSSPTAPSAALLEAVYEALYYKLNSTDSNFIVTIEDGVYHINNIYIELTNQFNYSVSQYIINYFTENSNAPMLLEFMNTGQYTEFNIILNAVSIQLSFGNKSSGFILTNDSEINYNIRNGVQCSSFTGEVTPAEALFGLSYWCGFNTNKPQSYTSIQTTNLNNVRMFGLVGTSGIWLTPTYNDSLNVYYINAPSIWNMFADKYYAYIDIAGYNSLDETQIFNTESNKSTSSKVNSSFAKLPIYVNSVFPTNNFYFNNCKYFDNIVKVFNPPISRLKRLCIRLKYHSGEYMNFGGTSYSFTLKFNIYLPQNAKSMTVFKPEGL